MTNEHPSNPSEHPSSPGFGQVLIYYDGDTRLQVRIEGRSVWLSQRLMADLFQVSVKTVNEHLINIYAEEELDREATIRSFRIVQREKNTASLSYINGQVIKRGHPATHKIMITTGRESLLTRQDSATISLCFTRMDQELKIDAA